jgi:subtilase family serine protease
MVAVSKRRDFMRGILAGGLLSAAMVLGLASGASAGEDVQFSGGVYHKAVCGRAVGLVARCNSRVVTDSAGHELGTKPGQRITGFGAPDLRAAYNISATGSSSTVIAIVDAFGYDNAEADLGVYRAQYSIPACTTANGCFKKLNQKGQQGPYPAQDIGWAQESALDLDMASAMCPNCQIWLFEANTNSFKNLAAAVDKAASLGAHVISNSYSGGDSNGATKFEPSYNHPGIAITASSGDAGYGTGTPAAMPHVIAVGGTHLVKDNSERGWTETVWRGAGSGCSKHYDKPGWQTDKGCKTRMEADVSAVADPATGVAVYAPNSQGDGTWLRFGGTSVSAPLIGGIFGANGGAVNDASTLYAAAGTFNDVTSGNNGTCKGGKKAYFCNGAAGYDGPTGIGTPSGSAAFGN